MKKKKGNKRRNKKREQKKKEEQNKKMEEDPYAVLGVQRNAEANEIKKAFYKLSLEYHPDKHADYKKEYTEIFLRISKAYELLSDKDKRETYDLTHADKNTIIYAEVCGKVDYVNPKNRSLFSIYAEGVKKRYRCNYEGFLPIREGDAILGMAQLTRDKRFGDTLVFENPPFVTMASDYDTIFKNLCTALKTNTNNKKASGILKVLQSRCQTFEEVLKELDEYSCRSCWEKETVDCTRFLLVADEKSMDKVFTWWYKNRVLRNLYLLGLNNKQIYNSKLSPLKLYEKCVQNPYMIPSIDLEKCDEILGRCGKKLDNNHKECGKIIRKISNLMENNGWTGVPSSFMSRMYPHLSQFLPLLKSEYGIQANLYTVYLERAYEVEVGIANHIKTLLNRPPIYDFEKFEVSNAIEETYSNSIKFTRDDLSREQKEGVKIALYNNISCLTGGAGCGKSCVIKEIVFNLENAGIPYRVASFTGKAVARIREVTGKKEPMTLNMMIVLAKDKGNSNTNNKKQGKGTFKHLIIDEASMVTTELLYEFIEKYGLDYKITFVGDCNQLSPISWGNLFEQLLKSEKIPTVRLKTIFRTANSLDNGILINANKIIDYKENGGVNEEIQYDEEGEPIEDDNNAGFQLTITNNFKIIPGDLETVSNLISVLNNNAIDPDKIVIISPYNRDLEVINNQCSFLYNGVRRSVKDSSGKVWRIGDRVMNTVNNYKLGIMNGTEGKVIDIGNNGISIQFDQNVHLYSLECNVATDDRIFGEDEIDTDKDLTCKQLIHSYCLTVHKTQGSEKSIVVGYIPKTNIGSTFLNCNLFYTMITRAKHMVYLVGDYDTMIRACTTRPAYRCDNLAKRLCEE